MEKAQRTLYRLVFPNGSSYVGITKQALVDRMGIHRNDARLNTSKLYVAWRELGEPEVQILGLIDDHLWEHAERLAIEVWRPDLNTHPGGNGAGKKHSDETRSRIGLGNRGKKMPPQSPEHRAKNSLAKTGKKFSVETRAKMSASHLARHQRKES